MPSAVLINDLVLFSAFIQDNDVRSYIVDNIPITMSKVMNFFFIGLGLPLLRSLSYIGYLGLAYFYRNSILTYQ